jgi:Arc/MetJ-type ribon-helix-helix transcriptional regulator
MTSNTKSSVTLPAEEVKRVRRLRARLRLKSNVDVVRAGLKLLEETTEREALREAFRRASLATRGSVHAELEELDHLAGEGLDGE